MNLLPKGKHERASKANEKNAPHKIHSSEKAFFITSSTARKIESRVHRSTINMRFV